MESTSRIIFTATLCLTLANPLPAAEFDERATARSFEFTYTTTIADIPAGLGKRRHILGLQ